MKNNKTRESFLSKRNMNNYEIVLIVVKEGTRVAVLKNVNLELC